MKLNVRVAGDRFRLAGVWVTACLLVMAAGNLLYLAGRGGITASVPDNSIRSLWDGEGQSGRHPYVQGIGQVVPAATKLGSQIAFPNVPLSFEANQGQTDAQVKFLSRGGGYTLFLTQDEAVLKLSSVVSRRSSAKHSTVSTQHSEATTSVVRMKLVGASRQADIRGANQLPSRSNYFVGNDPAKWRRNVAQFARVRYGQVYPGIDLVYYGNQGRLEYDFVIAPGADPQQIGWQIEGANNLHLSEKGDLVAETAAGDVQLHAPMVYQNIDDQKRAVTGKFVLSLGHRVQFRLGQYDRRRELVIDPQLTFAAYFGGNADEGCAFITGAYTSPVAGCPAVAVDGNLNRYVALTTTSATFPTAPAGYQTGLQGTANVFVAKFNAAGVLQNETYLGGDTVDSPVGIRVDPAGGNVYVAGNTTSSNFPFKNEFQSGPLSTANHVFVSVLSNDLSALNYSTYLSGTGTDTATGLAIDSTAGAYVSGYTTSTEHGTGFPSTSTAFQVSPAAANQFFFTKINTAATGAGSVVYSSYLGGSAGGTGRTVGGGIAADSAGNVYLTGGTDFTDMPVLNAYQATSRGGMDAFVAKFNVNQTGPASRKYVTYLGGTGDDIGYGIAVDASGNAYVAGGTSSTNFTVPTSPAPFQSTNAGSEDAFVAKIGTGGNTLSYFSYLGGTATDVAYAIAVDVDQAAHITGVTASSNFPQVDAVTGTGAGSGASAFVALLQTTFSGTTGGYSSYLESAGANGNTDGTGIAVDLNANTYIIGETSSSGFPATNGSTLSGGSDAFLARILPTATGITITASTSVTSGSTAGIGNQVTFTYAIKNTGPGVATNVLFTDILPVSGATFASASSTPGSCTAAVNGSVTCAIGSLGGTSSSPGQATVKINLTPTVAGTLTNNGTLQANGAPAGASSASVTVSDFTVGVSPGTISVAAGDTATYQVQIGNPGGQTSFFPDAISLSCSAGVPTGAACTFSTNPVTLTSTSPISSTLTLTTTARPVTTTGGLERFRLWYATVLPITGITFLGLGIGVTRRRRWAIGISAVLVFAFAGFQLACSGSNGTTPPPAGTPAGTYPITLTGTSGSASHAVRMTLVVQ